MISSTLKHGHEGEKMKSNPSEAMPFAKLLGGQVSGAGPDRVVGPLLVRSEICTAGNIVHGGAIMAFADSIGALGAFLTLPEGAKGTATIESKTNFLGIAPVETTLVGTLTPVKIGRGLSVWQTRMDTKAGDPVALTTQTQFVL